MSQADVESGHALAMDDSANQPRPRRIAAVESEARTKLLFTGKRRATPEDQVSSDSLVIPELEPSGPSRPKRRKTKSDAHLTSHDDDDQKRESTECVTDAIQDKTLSEQNCSICLAVIENRCVALECEHEFCKKCLMEWVTKSSSTCPICRADVVKVRYGFTKKGKFKEKEIRQRDERNVGSFNDLMERFSIFVDFFFTSNTNELSDMFDDMLNAMVPGVGGSDSPPSSSSAPSGNAAQASSSSPVSMSPAELVGMSFNNEDSAAGPIRVRVSNIPFSRRVGGRGRGRARIQFSRLNPASTPSSSALSTNQLTNSHSSGNARPQTARRGRNPSTGNQNSSSRNGSRSRNQ